MIWLLLLVAQQEITKLPVLKSQVEAIYPADALRDRVEAIVSMELDISAEGSVEAVHVVFTSSVGAYGFVRSATTAASKLQFEPAEAGGVAVPVRVPYTYRFVLPPLPPPPPIATATVAAPKIVSFTGVIRER